jgi:hypothetical protein
VRGGGARTTLRSLRVPAVGGGAMGRMRQVGREKALREGDSRSTSSRAGQELGMERRELGTLQRSQT